MRESSGLPRAIVAERELEALRERIAFYESADRDAQAVLARLTDLAQRTSEIRARATAEIMAELERITVALARQQAEGPRAATEPGRPPGGEGACAWRGMWQLRLRRSRPAARRGRTSRSTRCASPGWAS